MTPPDAVIDACRTRRMPWAHFPTSPRPEPPRNSQSAADAFERWQRMEHNWNAPSVPALLPESYIRPIIERWTAPERPKDYPDPLRQPHYKADYYGPAEDRWTGFRAVLWATAGVYLMVAGVIWWVWGS